MKKHFSSFDLEIDHLFPSEPRKESKRKKNNSACVSNLDDLLEGAQAKTTKYATKYAVNVFKVIFAFNYYNKFSQPHTVFLKNCTIKLNANSMLQTANVLKSNITRPIGLPCLTVKWSKNDPLNLEECTRQLTRMMELMPSDFAAVNSTLPACAIDSKPAKLHKARWAIQLLNHLLGLPGRASLRLFQERSSAVTFILKFFPHRVRKSLEYFLCFHRTLGISLKDLEGFKADIAFIYTTLACSLTIWTLIWLL